MALIYIKKLHLRNTLEPAKLILAKGRLMLESQIQSQPQSPPVTPSNSILSLIKSYSIYEIVFICVLSTVVGVAYWGWTFFHELTSPFLKIIGLKYLSSGFWLFIGLFLPFIIRKPLVAIGASIIAAGVSGFITHWGIMALLWGLVQGLGAELAFFIFGYKKWDFKVLALAALLSASFSYSLDYFYYGYGELVMQLNLTQYISFVLSALLLASYLSYTLARRLNRLHLLNRFLIAEKAMK